MMVNRLREEYLAMDIPELKKGIMERVTGAPSDRSKNVRLRRKVRPAAVLAAALMLALLGVTAGAVTNGLLKLKNGSYYTFIDAEGSIVKPKGFHVEDGVDVPLSDAALARIAPYVFLYAEDETCFEIADPAGMEAFIDRSMHLPEKIKDAAELYRLWAYGTPEYTATIYVEIVSENVQDTGSMKVYLRGGPINITTESDPVMHAYALSDGTPVQIAVADNMDGVRTGYAFYRYEDAVYELRVTGGNSHEILRQLQEILDTVG
ncbi:MAG: hypothetical protein IJX14_02540 [Clostridia bacterium]|nr:hypothetical protein [Clostridia bacterium]